MSDIAERVKKIVVEHLGVEAAQVKEDAKFIDIYGVDNASQDGRTKLEDALGALGHKPGDIRWVINTHLHFDHAGGDNWIDPSGKMRRLQTT